MASEWVAGTCGACLSASPCEACHEALAGDLAATAERESALRQLCDVQDELLGRISPNQQPASLMKRLAQARERVERLTAEALRAIPEG